jgi:hypothetical protein
MTNIKVTEASAAASAARRDWRAHLDLCATCANARHRRGRPRCADGELLRGILADAERALDAERADARKPGPGQLPLWPSLLL